VACPEEDLLGALASLRDHAAQLQRSIAERALEYVETGGPAPTGGARGRVCLQRLMGQAGKGFEVTIRPTPPRSKTSARRSLHHSTRQRTRTLSPTGRRSFR
jgi:hypothetical protein